MPDIQHRTLKICSLQPFYGGSHKQFMRDWIRHSGHEWQIFSLPPRHWKWRMRHAAIEFAQQTDDAWNEGRRFDLIFCTDMLNLAEFNGLLKTEAKNLPTVLYFHENQFAYPNRFEDPRDFHFSFTNFTSALAADCVWFNSQFNHDSMMSELKKLSEKWPDYSPNRAIDSITGKSEIQPPGIEIPDGVAVSMQSDVLHIVWAARWEHDKNPDLLFEILTQLKSNNVEFKLSVLGESFRETPNAFVKIESEFQDQICGWGYQETRQDYFAALAAGNVFLSTADHEFFGLAAVEAIASGLVPLLPNRLAYPEILREDSIENSTQYLYNSVDEAVQKLIQIQNGLITSGTNSSLSKTIFDRYSAKKRAVEMDQALATATIEI